MLKVSIFPMWVFFCCSRLFFLLICFWVSLTLRLSLNLFLFLVSTSSKFESLSIFPSLNRSLPLFQPSMNLSEGIRPAVMYQSYFFMTKNGVLNSEALKNPREAKTDGGEKYGDSETGKLVRVGVTEKDFVGKWMVMYFGFTHYPYICPDELQKLVALVDKIKEKARIEIVSVFISADPGRDTVEQVRECVKKFHPKLVGLTGNLEENFSNQAKWENWLHNYADARIQLNSKAKFFLTYALSRSEYDKVHGCDTAKEMWDTLSIAHEGTSQVKESKISILVH
ncbi:hypothetical protein K2173_010573 [Erythroxylum novogranatense]|uniref:Uncharacterized protein n=1 Tax=Erythroxylum novogranatense TaxID=1862640 RepID=A0AAV8TGD4_9ROSI|nr:hypothetical protein K2173_010573 [Erythroxylum novogranatense]